MSTAQSEQERAVKLTRISAGNYHADHGGHSYDQRVRSDYGDVQWVIDRDGYAPWAQAASLAQARRYIADD